jgi:hypothetical protein
MKYICDPKYGYHEFDTPEECLRYESACEAERSGAGWLLAIVIVLCLLLFT